MAEETECQKEAELDEDPVAPGSVPRASVVSTCGLSVEVRVVVATSDMIRTDPSLVSKIYQLVNAAYGYHRLSQGDVRQRVAMGDAGESANRVLHLAYRSGQLLGACSSTIQAPWTSQGCGHWGLLSVDPAAQGTGVASALVNAAERRLILSGRKAVQIEYEYTCGDEFSERLYKWYEGKLGFQCVSGRPRSSKGSCEFRKCLKQLPKKPPPLPVDQSQTVHEENGKCPGQVVEPVVQSTGEVEKTKPVNGCARCVLQ